MGEGWSVSVDDIRDCAYASSNTSGDIVIYDSGATAHMLPQIAKNSSNTGLFLRATSLLQMLERSAR